MGRVAARVDTFTVALDEGRLALRTARARFTGHRRAWLGLARSPTAAAIQQVVFGIEAARSARQSTAAAGKGTCTLHADGGRRLRSDTRDAAAAAVVRITVERNTFFTAGGLPLAAARAGGILGAVPDADALGAAVVSRQAAVVGIALQSLEAGRQAAVAGRNQKAPSRAQEY
jgi:hypothetical protein